ncbi:MAG TPA: hypothetical protein VMZ73_00150 [Acidimicrobiales bacterium]|nr:hypothetical protein [Acidimicrobiales bacterium]
MSDDTRPKAGSGDCEEYEAPAIRHLGNLADLTQKTVGQADGSTFLGLDIGSI